MGLKFKRQMPIDCYIVDFICAEHRLIVEVDGSQHAENDYDEKRDTELAKCGFTTLRFWNNEILQNIDNVCAAIHAAVQVDRS